MYIYNHSFTFTQFICIDYILHELLQFFPASTEYNIPFYAYLPYIHKSLIMAVIIYWNLRRLYIECHRVSLIHLMLATLNDILLEYVKRELIPFICILYTSSILQLTVTFYIHLLPSFLYCILIIPLPLFKIKLKLKMKIFKMRK